MFECQIKLCDFVSSNNNTKCLRRLPKIRSGNTPVLVLCMMDFSSAPTSLSARAPAPYISLGAPARAPLSTTVAVERNN